MLIKLFDKDVLVKTVCLFILYYCFYFCVEAAFRKYLDMFLTFKVSGGPKGLRI